MNIKQIIGLIIFIFAIIGVGIFGYVTITGKSVTNNTVTTTAAEILPEGNELKFDTINKFNRNKRIFRYPVVTTSEIGQPLNEVIERKTIQ